MIPRLLQTKILLVVLVLCLNIQFIKSLSPCDVIGYKIYLKSGERPTGFFDYSSRRPVQSLKDGDNVCYTDWGDNIEAILHNPVACKSSIEFELYNSDTNVLLYNNSESMQPYLLHSDLGPSRILGKTLNFGKYQLKTNPSYNTTDINIINFKVIKCSYYNPPNECTNCNLLTHACEGTLCISQGYLRFTLIYSGNNIWDYGLKITSPKNTTIGAYYYGSDTIPIMDSITNGYVDEDFKYDGCRSIGVWTKNIIYPKNNYTSSGTYTIKLEDVENCRYISDKPGYKEFELKIYKNNNLKKVYTNTDGKSFKFTVDE